MPGVTGAGSVGQSVSRHPRMEFFSDEDIRVERIWCGEGTGTKLVVQHVLSGMSAERVIGFDDESRHRRELVVELSHRFSAQYPARDFVMEHMWSGPGKGSSLCLRHTPSGVAVGRVVGYEPVGRYRREMMAELFERLREHESAKRK